MTDARRQPQIVAIGGGGFAADQDNLLVERYVVSTANRDWPKVLFLATASGDAQDYIERFYEAFDTLSCRPSHLSLFSPSTLEIESLVFGQDIILVGGGNPKSMLALWREWRLDMILREAWQQGIVLAGVNAGSSCWFEHGIANTSPGSPSAFPGLGFLPMSNCPQFDSEPDRQAIYRKLVQEGTISGGYAADAGVALHFMGSELYGIVTARPSGKARRIERSPSGVVETVLTPVPLSDYLMIS
jgi:dipeptidase E